MSHSLSAWQDQENQLAGFTRLGSSDAPIVHLMHGNGFCSTTLWPLASHFPADWNLWFADVPGHGLSAQPQGYMPNWLRLARKVGEGLETRLGNYPERKVIGLGHSMGGILTLMLAAERPHLFERIVLLDPVLFSPEIIWLQKALRKTGLWRYSRLVRQVAARRQQWPDSAAMSADLQQKTLYKNWHPQALSCFIQDGTQLNPQGKLTLSCQPSWEASIFGSYPRGLWEAVKRVQVPVSILLASDSYRFIQHSTQRAQKLNPLIDYQVVSGSHCFPMEQPQISAERILQLLG